MVFQKTCMQGNFVFANGERAIFTDGSYETSDEAEIKQLKQVYAVADGLPEKLAEKQPAASPARASAGVSGAVSSATLAAVSKESNK